MNERLDLLISAQRIRRKVAELARRIDDDHRGAEVALIAVLKGATIFAADLMRQITIPFTVDFVAASSYRGTRSSGTVLVRDEAGLDIRGRHVILIEDIVDTGLTVRALLQSLGRLEPASIDLCALLSKRVEGAPPVTIRYQGFDIPDVFVVGYGMDYAERFRNLSGIYKLNPRRPDAPLSPGES